MKFRNMEKEKYRDYIYVTPGIEGSDAIKERTLRVNSSLKTSKSNKTSFLNILIRFIEKFFNK